MKGDLVLKPVYNRLAEYRGWKYYAVLTLVRILLVLFRRRWARLAFVHTWCHIEEWGYAYSIILILIILALIGDPTGCVFFTKGE